MLVRKPRPTKKKKCKSNTASLGNNTPTSGALASLRCREQELSRPAYWYFTTARLCFGFGSSSETLKIAIDPLIIKSPESKSIKFDY